MPYAFAGAVDENEGTRHFKFNNKPTNPIYFCATCRSGTIHPRDAPNENMRIDKNNQARKAGPLARSNNEVSNHIKFGILFFLAVAWTSRQSNLLASDFQSITPHSTVGENHQIKFKRTEAGELVTTDGTKLRFTNFIATDAILVKVMYWDFDNSAQTTEIFNKQINHASKIVKHERKLNSEGKEIGERAQLVFDSLPCPGGCVAIMWTDGPKFREVISTSSTDALELEKIYKY